MNTRHSPQVLLLPGLLNDGRLWHDQLSGLSRLTNVTVADLTREDTMSALATSVLSQIPAKRFALAGLSMGGYVALEIIRQAPERVVGLALIDTSARPDTPESKQNRLKLMRLAKTDFNAVIEILLPKLILPSHQQEDCIVKVITAMAVDHGKDVFTRQQTAIMHRVDSRPLLPQINCPTLVLCGREDVITPVEVHEEMAASIPHSTLTIVENCGHLSALEQPQQVTAALERWLLSIKA